MKVTLNWLKQYVDFNWTPEELRDRLTMIGIEVEGMDKIGGEFEGVVVAQILASDKHPNADKLSVCRVADGQGERQIVCGAKNYKVGDKVPLALPGCTLPAPTGAAPFTIKVGKLRGVESCGMMCSGKELGLSEDASGLLILPPEARVGQTFAAYLNRAQGDVVYDLEITPNRPDLNSVMGIAREISAINGCPVRIPAAQFEEAPVKVTDMVDVRIEDAELCPRYVARIIKNVVIGPSPDWMKQMLEKVGLRSINNVVDVTNYVMLETGQPLHAFDLHLLTAKPEAPTPVIVVRRADEGETFVTLDGQERTLTANMLMIADETKSSALAGIMGGQNTEINERTVDVLLESACFKPQNIRATSKQLELKSDASYRFERGADIGNCEYVSRRAAQLIVQIAGGQIAAGAVDAYPKTIETKRISLRFARTNSLLGVNIPAEQQRQYLQRLGLEPISSGADGANADSVTVSIPTFRVDLKREVDLIEEIGRLFGVENIPAHTQLGTIGAHAFDQVYDQLAEARQILIGLGLSEAQGQTLINETSARLVAGEAIPLQNPLSGDMNVLRSSLLPGLLDSLHNNVGHKTSDISLFEIGRVFNRQADGPGRSRTG